MNDSPRLDSLSALIDDFANTPLRLFFLTACLLAVFVASCWIIAYFDGWFFVTQPIDLQCFLCVQSIASVAFVGFFFTTFSRWLGDAAPLGNNMKSLWLIVFFATLSAPMSLSVALSMMVLLWSYIFAMLSWLIWKNRDSRQTSMLWVIAIVVLLTLRLAIKSWQTPELEAYDWQQQLHAIVLGIALLSFRIGHTLGNQALKDANQFDSQFIPNPFIKNLSIWLFYLLIFNNFFIKNSATEGWLSLAVAGAMLGRLRDFHFVILLKRHYVCWLYITLLMIAIGYGWRGLALIEIVSAM